MFDEAFDTADGVRGGRFKELALLSEDGVPYTVKFKGRPSLNSLFAELASAFAVRYRKERPQNELDNERQLLQQGGQTPDTIQKVLEMLPAHRHQHLTERLRRPKWLVETINRYLQNRSLWPTDDKAISQFVGTADGTRKRTLEQTRMELQVPRQRKMPKTA
jgi:hypothetical protein